MKNLFLVRHGKSSWDLPELDDFERPLNNRGRLDAPLMARLLKNKKIKPDIMISSPASRAAMTTRIISGILDYPTSDIFYADKIYDAGIPELIQTIKTIGDHHTSAMLIGHNPGLTFLANHLADHHITNLPTCGICAIDLDIRKWSQTTDKCGKFRFLEFPKGQK
jgi:phosphohistidine phosphatase